MRIATGREGKTGSIDTESDFPLMLYETEEKTEKKEGGGGRMPVAYGWVKYRDVLGLTGDITTVN